MHVTPLWDTVHPDDHPSIDRPVGVAERFNRTLKEQAIHGSLFRDLEEVRQAVSEFRDRYDRHRHLEKPGFLSSREARQSHAIRKAASNQLRTVH
ncbi:integrase core domain-containing protein [Methylococcus capsulatus]|uniref:integrase core domain-containing protein n=1 Tax=Methylococcus capsulatus TaxID=414 RepID=UPI0013777178|nr:integrase core domain-containing protein [Methylococcus capsulatus]